HHVPGPAVPGGQGEYRLAVRPGRLEVAERLVQYAELGTGGDLPGHVPELDEGGQRRLDLGQPDLPVAVLGRKLADAQPGPGPYGRVGAGGTRVVQQYPQPLPPLPVLAPEAPPAGQYRGQAQRGDRVGL